MNDDRQETAPSREEQERIYEQWVKGQLDGHATHLFKQGLIDGAVQVGIAWALPGRLCIGFVRSKKDARKAFWVISGDIPTDHLVLDQAKDAREAAKHFALKWQLQATRLAESQSVGRTGEGDRVFSDAGSKLAQKAEALYALTEQDEHWQPAPSFSPAP